MRYDPMQFLRPRIDIHTTRLVDRGKVVTLKEKNQVFMHPEDYMWWLSRLGHYDRALDMLKEVIEYNIKSGKYEQTL